MAWDGVIITGEKLGRAKEKVLRRDYQASRMHVKATKYYLTRFYLNQIANQDHSQSYCPHN